MKKIYLLAFIPLLFSNLAWAKLSIKKVDINALLDKDGYLIVAEKYEVSFLTPHHGIYRNIPLFFYDYTSHEKRKIKIEGIYIEDCKGNKIPFHTKYRNGHIYIYMGDPKKRIIGKRCYELTYRVDGIIGKYKEFQILGYNFVGSGWGIPLENLSVSLSLPEDVKPEKFLCFWKKRTPCPQKNHAWFFNKLPPHTPVTVWVSWKHPTLPERVYKGGISSNLIAMGLLPLAIPVVWFLFLFAYWREKGKDPQIYRTEMVFYEPPMEITPLESGVLVDFKLDAKDIAAALINLAIKRYLKITQIASPILLGFGGDYKIEVLKDITPRDKNINYDELLVAQKVFGITQIPKGMSMKLSDLRKEKEKMRALYKTLESVINGKLKATGYLSKGIKDYTWISGTSFGVVFTTLVLSIIVSSRIKAITGEEFRIFNLPMPIIAYGLVFLTIVISPFIVKAMAKRTKKGAETVWKLKGFMEFVNKVEIEKLKKLFPPEKYPVIFEKYFPYAMALGVADKWARKFEPLLSQINYSSGWYSGTSHFRASSFATNFASSMKSSTGSRSIGGAGGGAGGGGGGGW